MCRDLQDLIRGVVAYGLDAPLEGPWRQKHQDTTGLIRYVPPTMLGFPWNGNTGNVHFLSKSSVVLFSFVHEVPKGPQPRPCGARLIALQCAEAD
jgi:hypothetical protein